ncbi:Redox-sensing transcriptional repressor Rex [Rubripirellula lacrimiformis]|uniref:Redox-sensing transcriptional repressor Rex n=1 Tax=Rubripirellula lacrimiformis TaxID=1930273 RepID=A0A517NC59_9BACT|nr:redox-sensing transcriptional repressor Rex [Rubripirellula lacrimiformis]QDT04723.1 Redox-sensing transcriptional repressor Rex [Rubripirellula lacrimiformis]
MADSQPSSESDPHAPVDGESTPAAGPLGKKSELPLGLPQPAVGRLSLYFRELHRLIETGVTSVNSRQLGRLVDVSPAVVRRDLSALGTIGRRGVGYDVQRLVDRIGVVLGSGTEWNVVLIGVGSLGDALLRYRGFQRLGFQLSGAFDNSPRRIGTTIAGVTVLDAAVMDDFLVQKPAQLAILAVPADVAGDIADRLVRGGVSGILNFAPTTIKLPPRVAIVNVDLASELQRLVFAVQSNKSPP